MLPFKIAQKIVFFNAHTSKTEMLVSTRCKSTQKIQKMGKVEQAKHRRIEGFAKYFSYPPIKRYYKSNSLIIVSLILKGFGDTKISETEGLS